MTPAKPNRERCLCVFSIKVTNTEMAISHRNVVGGSVNIGKGDKIESTCSNIANCRSSRCKLCFKASANVSRGMMNLELFSIKRNDLIAKYKKTRAVRHVNPTVQRRYSGNVVGKQRGKRRK